MLYLNYSTFKPFNVKLSVVSWVWANPLSLAATKGISVDFFSSGY